MMRYSSQFIKNEITLQRQELFVHYAKDRPINWSVDERTKDLICLTAWLRREMILIELDSVGRIIQEGEFNRASRSQEDLFQLAADIMNATVEGRFDRNRKPHKRWG